jgi:hypothetical protein
LVEPSGWHPLREPLLDYLIYGVPHAFPGKIGGPTRGVPTGWASPCLKESLPQGADLPPVWPYSGGKTAGHAVEALYWSVPLAVKALPGLYEPLALIDAIRIGRARDREMARELLRKLLTNDPSLAN